MNPPPNHPDQDKPSLPARYARLLLHRRPVFVAALALLSLFAAIGLTRLNFDTDPRTIFQSDDSNFAQLEEYIEQFGADDNNLLLVLRGDGFFTPAFSERLHNFTAAATELHGVAKVGSILDVAHPLTGPLYPKPDRPLTAFTAAESLLSAHPFVGGHLLSDDGRTMLLTVTLVVDGPQSMPKVDPIFQNLRQLARDSFGDLDIETSYTGSVAIRIETLLGVRREFFKILVIGVLVSTLIALLLFRRLTTTLLVASGPFAAVLWTLGTMGWLSFGIDGISTPLPAIVFVVSFANAVHLMLDIIRSRSSGHSHREAACDAIGHLGLACFLTSLTTAIGFISLLLAQTTSVQHFGLSCALGAGFGLLANLTVLPLLASISKRGAIRNPNAEAAEHRASSLIARTGSSLIKFAKPITILAFVATAILTWSATRLRSDIVWTETLPTDSEVTRAMTQCDEAFGGTLGAYVIVEWDDSLQFGDPAIVAILRDVERLADQNEVFGGALSLLDFVPPDSSPALVYQAVNLVPPAALRRLLRRDLHRTILAIRLPNSGAAIVRPAVASMRNKLAQLQSAHPQFNFTLTGTSIVAAENLTSVIGDLVRSISFAAVTVFLVLTIALRSVVLGLLSIIPNAFPLLLNAGMLAFLDKPLQITSVLTFSICLGIAVDDTIHFLMRFLRERKLGSSVRDAIVHAFEHVGTALLITTAVMTGGFLGAMTSDLPGIVLFGTLACSAMIAALLGDLLILPAMLATFLARKPVAAASRRRP